MELTKVDQTLLQAITAYSQGNLQEAESLYRAILKVQPNHPHANHNLGLIAVFMNQPSIALPMFKAATDANPSIEQFWVSYIDALITEREFENAKQAIKEGKEKGVAKEKLKILLRKLASVKKLATPIEAPSHAQMQELLNHYKSRRYRDAENLAILLTQKFPKHQFSWKILGIVFGQTDRRAEALVAIQEAIVLTPSDAEAHYNLGIVLQELGRLDEAEENYRQAVSLKTNYVEAHCNLGLTLQTLGKLDKAEESYRQAIKLAPDFAEAYNNLGNLQKELGRLEEAKTTYRQALALKDDFAEAHNNLGVTLQELENLEGAESRFRQAIKLKPGFNEARSNLGNILQKLGRLGEAEATCRHVLELQPGYAEAHNNLGITLHALGKLEEAEHSYRQAIALKPSLAEAPSNLGLTLQELGRLEEAEHSYRQAIALKPNLALAHQNLGVTLYLKEDIDSALVSIEKATYIDPKSKSATLLLSLLRSKKSTQESDVDFANISNPSGLKGLTFNPLILNRPVEAELIASLYEMNSRKIAEARDARYGNGSCSTDFNLFDDNRSIIKTVARDLTGIMTDAVKSAIHIDDSFFNILGPGSGTTPHQHINGLDKIKGLSLDKKKYSLAYYLSEGDQNFSEPGILKLYDPNEDILPHEGMITIIPSTRRHSSAYSGGKDRIMIGINFYSL